MSAVALPRPVLAITSGEPADPTVPPKFGPMYRLPRSTDPWAMLRVMFCDVALMMTSSFVTGVAPVFQLLVVFQSPSPAVPTQITVPMPCSEIHRPAAPLVTYTCKLTFVPESGVAPVGSIKR